LKKHHDGIDLNYVQKETV